VDELGGFTRAIEVAKGAVGIPLDQDVRLTFYPRPKGAIERLAQYTDARSASTASSIWQRLVSATLPSLSFPDGAILALMGETVDIH